MARQYQLKQEQKPGGSGIDYSKELNEQQFAAVTSKPGPALVIAGAGSGKTRTLTYRVAYLLDQGVDPRNILLLTFTNKASKEMLERVRELVPYDLSALWGGTFHSIGNRMMRRHADELGLTRSFSILDRDDQKSLLNTVIKDCKIDTKQRRFPKADVLATIFSLVENTGETLEEIIECRYDYFEEWALEIAKVYEAYRAKKKEVNSVDFDDLLVRTVELLEGSEELCGLYQKKFQYVLVDEFQDTNEVQSRFIDLLVRDHQSLMVVGDDAQSIYSWRGADMDHILNFSTRYPTSETYKIETNYRSVPGILELSNEAIKANQRQIPKELQASREPHSELPALVPVPDPSTQATFIAQRILELQNEGIELEEMAVLYRAHHQSLEIQMELTNREVPFQITSGLRFFEQAHIKDIAAFLRFVSNRRDEVSFKRMVSLLPGVGPASADKLWQQWVKTGWCEKEALPDQISKVLIGFSLPKKAVSHWEQLVYTLDELISPEGSPPPSEMIYSVLEGVYDDFMRGSFDNYEHRRQDIEQLREYAFRFTDIQELLSQLSLMSSVDGEPSRAQQQEEDSEKLTLSSIHQAKGLEWKVVFVVWLTEGMFPNKRVLDSEDEESLEEERRLFYVAITRAKDDLYLIYPQMNPKSYTGDVIQYPSRFIDECPAELMEEWEVAPAW